MLNPLFRIQKYALLNPRTIFLHTSFGRRLLLVVFLVVKFLLDLKKSQKKSHKIIGHFNKKVGKTHIRPWKQCNLYSLDSRQWWFLLIRRSEQKVKHSFFLLRMGCVSALYTEEMLKTSGTREPSLLPRFWYSPWFHPLKTLQKKYEFLGRQCFSLRTAQSWRWKSWDFATWVQRCGPGPRIYCENCSSKLQFGGVAVQLWRILRWFFRDSFRACERKELRIIPQKLMGRGGGGWSLSAFRWSVVLDCFQWSCWPHSWPACPTPARWIPPKNADLVFIVGVKQPCCWL